MKVLGVERSFQSLRAEIHNFARRSAADAQDGLMLVHDLHVVHALSATVRTTDVFKLSAHISLAIEIIRQKARLMHVFHRCLKHGLYLGIIGQFIFFQVHFELRAALQGKRVERHIVGRER